MILSHIPTLFAASNQQEEGYKEQFNWKDVFTEQIKVQIKNSLDGGENITFDCKSYDDNLGTHTLIPGQSYEWKFRYNFWGDTRFFCHLRWREYSVHFDAWKKKETECSKLCVYEATNDVIIGPDRYIHWTK